jgi:hypothetical protein
MTSLLVDYAVKRLIVTLPDHVRFSVSCLIMFLNVLDELKSIAKARMKEAEVDVGEAGF